VTDALLSIDRLEKSFGGASVLGPVSARIATGSLTAIIGRSGCGKSTLLRCLGGLETPTSGEIRTLERTQVGYVFQEPRLMPWLDVRRNAGFGLAHLPLGGRDAAVDEALAVVGLTDAAGLLPKELSGGMAQRAALARALAARPALLLLDEPFSALDPLTRAQMQAHLLAVRRHYDPTMVLITHDMDEALALADRVLVLRGPPGRVVADVRVDLPAPRDRMAPAFLALKRELTDALSEQPAEA
jgi:sulfonate transport system ATP-binding protein